MWIVGLSVSSCNETRVRETNLHRWSRGDEAGPRPFAASASKGPAWSAAKENLETRARELRQESLDSGLPDGLRREVAAQLSAAKLELAELLESLEASMAVEVMVGDDGILASAITGLEAQIAVGEGRGRRDPSSEASASAARVPKGVQ